MNRKRIFGIALLVTAALLVITTGVVFAVSNYHGIPPFRSDDEFDRGDQYFYGHMGGYGRHMRSFDEENTMMPLMVEAVAAETGLTVEEVETRFFDGESLHEIALDSGMSEEAFFDLMIEIREGYLSEALEKGWITEDQYDWMVDHMAEEPFDGQEGFHCPYYNSDSSIEGRPYYGRGMHW